MTTNTDTPTTEVLEGEYRGSAMLIIRGSPQDRFPFQFGVKKARMILDHIEEIKAFVGRYGNK